MRTEVPFTPEPPLPTLSRYDEFMPSKDERKAFDCGKQELNTWLAAYAGQAMDSRDAVVYLLHERRDIWGYFSLSSGSVSRDQAGRLAKRAPQPVPMMLLGRMAIDCRIQGKGLGAELLRQALLRALRATSEIGARGIMLHAFDDDARGFYERFGFEESPITQRLMMMTFAEIEATLATGGRS